ncbi:MAG TPA: phosphoribosylglycinamide formyltransferase [Puia sp.]|jgi:phosphoribosylglycinamide formyltransferase-1
MKETQIHIALFASGRSSNAEQIIHYFHQEAHPVSGRRVLVSLIVCNKPGAGVLEIAERERIPSLLIQREEFFRGAHYLEELKKREISFLVLAGFLWKIPPELIRAYPDRIINIHPALLPAYGGKGMYGTAVHQAVISAGEKESGISIHQVDELYDHGQVLFQVRCKVSADDSPDSLAKKIHALEHAHYPAAIARWMESKLSLNP